MTPLSYSCYPSYSRASIPKPSSQPSLELHNRFAVLNKGEDCSLQSSHEFKSLKLRSAKKDLAFGEDPNRRWAHLSIVYHTHALNWLPEGEAKTSEHLATTLANYLSTLSIHSARRLSSVHCKEILIAALIVTNPAPLKACMALKLYQCLAPTDLPVILEVAIQLDHSNFLSLLSTETEAIKSEEAYNNALFKALRYFRFGCLMVLLKYIHPHHISPSQQSHLNIDLEAMIDTLFWERQEQLKKEPKIHRPQIEDFLSCLEALIDLGQALQGGEIPTNPIQGSTLLNQPSTEAELKINAAILSSFLKDTSSNEDQKAILALFLDKGWLTCHFCQEHAVFSPIYSQIQSLRRSKHTKKAYAEA
jgi:hypothetical protein